MVTAPSPASAVQRLRPGHHNHTIASVGDAELLYYAPISRGEVVPVRRQLLPVSKIAQTFSGFRIDWGRLDVRVPVLSGGIHFEP